MRLCQGCATAGHRWHSEGERDAEWQDLPFINPWLLCHLHIPPDESQNWFVVWQQEYRVEHTFDAATHRNWIQPERGHLAAMDLEQVQGGEDC